MPMFAIDTPWGGLEMEASSIEVVQQHLTPARAKAMAGGEPIEVASVPEAPQTRPQHPVFDADLKSEETEMSNVGDTFRNFMVQEEGFENGVHNDGAGNQTIGIGHKLLPDELKNGVIRIGEEDVKLGKDGLTDAQVNALFEQDMSPFMDTAKEMISQGGLEHVPNIHEALSSLLFNYGTAAFKRTKAYKGLIRGDLKTFKREAFDPKVGIVYADGKPILRNRRRAELELMNPNRGIERTIMGPMAEGGEESLTAGTDSGLEKVDFTPEEQEKLSNLFGPLTKEGRQVANSLKFPVKTQDEGFIPDIGKLLPMIKAGRNVFGLNKMDMLNSGVNPDLADNAPKSLFNQGLIERTTEEKVVSRREGLLRAAGTTLPEVITILREEYGYNPKDFVSGLKLIEEDLPKGATNLQKEAALLDWFINILARHMVPTFLPQRPA